MLSEEAWRALGRSTCLGGRGCGGPKIPLQIRNLNLVSYPLAPGFQLLNTLECLPNQGVA